MKYLYDLLDKIVKDSDIEFCANERCNKCPYKKSCDELFVRVVEYEREKK